MTTGKIRLAAAAVAAALTGGLPAADVAWTFEGDDTRPAASTATSAGAVASFASWTMEAAGDTSPAIAFSSAPPALAIVIR